MACCLAEGTCCACLECSGLLASCCMPSCCAADREGADEKAVVAKNYARAKWFYLTGFTITIILTWILKAQSASWFASYLPNSFCTQPPDVLCAQQEIALRISFGNFCFFALHFLALLACNRVDDWRIELHTHMLFPQFLLWIGTLIGFFFIPSNVLYGYAQAARAGSGIFLVVQLILLVHLVYEINEWLVERDDHLAWALLISGTLVGLGLGLTLIGFSYQFYSPFKDCSLNLFFITFSIVTMFFLFLVLFVPNRAPTAGLMTSSLVFLYCCFLLYSALHSEPTEYVCVSPTASSGNWLVVVGFFICLASVVYSTFSAGVGSRDMFGYGDKDDEYPPYRAEFFHLVFALASMYIAMLFSNWSVSPSTKEFSIDYGWGSTWAKMAAKWACEALYTWTVLAPAIFPDRDFGYGTK